MIAGGRAQKSLVIIRDILHASLNATDPGELFQFALERVSPAVDASFASIYLVDGASEVMRLAAAYNWPERFRPVLSEVRVRMPFGPSGQAASERRVVRVEDVFADPELEDWQEVATELGFRAIVALPLVANTNVLGVLTFYFTDRSRIAEEALELMNLAADQIAAAAEKTLLSEALRRAEAALADAEADRERIAELPAPSPTTSS
ncbi:MAG TPA: GAF domain-containing protein [Gemmatimonadaceae bacterium]|nr:GAF domain-containing protein [Gemmatimonadaceae bacterium]